MSDEKEDDPFIVIAIFVAIFVIGAGISNFFEKEPQQTFEKKLQQTSNTQNIESQKPEQKVTWGNVNRDFLNLERKRSKTFELLMEKGKHKE